MERRNDLRGDRGLRGARRVRTVALVILGREEERRVRRNALAVDARLQVQDVVAVVRPPETPRLESQRRGLTTGRGTGRGRRRETRRGAFATAVRVVQALRGRGAGGFVARSGRTAGVTGVGRGRRGRFGVTRLTQPGRDAAGGTTERATVREQVLTDQDQREESRQGDAQSPRHLCSYKFRMPKVAKIEFVSWSPRGLTALINGKPHTLGEVDWNQSRGSAKDSPDAALTCFQPACYVGVPHRKQCLLNSVHRYGRVTGDGLCYRFGPVSFRDSNTSGPVRTVRLFDGVSCAERILGVIDSGTPSLRRASRKLTNPSPIEVSAGRCENARILGRNQIANAMGYAISAGNTRAFLPVARDVFLPSQPNAGCNDPLDTILPPLFCRKGPAQRGPRFISFCSTRDQR